MSARDITEEERKWIARFRRVIAAKPDTLWLMASMGAIGVYPDEEGAATRGHDVAWIGNPKVDALG